MKKELFNGEKFTKKFIVTDPMIKQFADVTGDKNPVHLNSEYASTTIFQKRIAHGFLVGSFISAVLGNDFPGNGTIYLSQELKFRAPVFINDRITVEVEILEFLSKNRLRLKTDCINQFDKVVIEGEAIVLPPKDSILLTKE